MKPEELRMYRNVVGLSRKEFSFIVGYDQHYLYLLETGRNPISVKTEQQIKIRLANERKGYEDVLRKITDILR